MPATPTSAQAQTAPQSTRAAIDLRSDTVTLPTPAMRAAMANAEVGDDVYSEDPTVNRLEELAAETLGKEAAVFVPSGTMGNAIAIITHCRRGDEIIMGDRSHTYLYEVGGAARLNGSATRAVPTLSDGTLDRARLAAAFLGDDVHEARTGLLCIEDTHNMVGGRVLSPATVRELAAPARQRGVPVHMDGARFFNAVVALGVPASALAAEVDSVTFCVSKGLSAPVGAVLVGSRDFITEARRGRKLLGGGMRQAGIIAAAGIIGLTEMVGRLAEDHTNARALAEGLATIPGIRLAQDVVETNIFFFEALGENGQPNPATFIGACEAQGVRFSTGDTGAIRAVTHYGVVAADIERALEVARRVMATRQSWV